jgi:hypothetical protein
MVTGPGVLAFDGERERVLKPDQRARMTLATRRSVGDRCGEDARAGRRVGAFRIQVGEPDGD